MFVVICFIVGATVLLSWAWVKGIDYMQENHPDYKGEDLFGEEESIDVTKTAGRDGWNDDAICVEGDF